MTDNQVLARQLEQLSSLAHLVDPKVYRFESILGRLGFKEEAAGKVRVFAMVDPFTQWLYKPLWDRICKVLRLIPQDGTFDQYKPLERLNDTLGVNSPRYCFDLSAATDRLPVLLQCQLLMPFMGS
jgi:hypothetical protein